MSKFRNYQTNFSGGLLSEGMLGRLDLAQYENGCKTLTNWWPKVTGGMRRRPGSIYLNTPVNAVRIESFIFSETQIYLVVFCTDDLGTDEVKFYDPAVGTLIDTVTITSPNFSTARLQQMSVTQTGDVMFIAHEEWPTIMLRRTSATTFAQETFTFESLDPATTTYPKAMPFIKYEDADITIACDDFLEGQVCTVTSSPLGAFYPRHENRAIRYRGKQLYVTNVPGAVFPSFTCTATIKEDLDQGAVLTFDPLVDRPQDFEVGEIVVGRTSGIKGEVTDKSNTSISLAMLAGHFPLLATEQVEGLNTGNIATITANTKVNPLPSADWDEEAFTTDQGFPSVIAFHAQRLWLAGSSSLPAHIFGSRASAYFNFDVGDAFPADSIQAVITDKQVNLITGLVSGRHLQVFTDVAEFYAPQSDDQPLTPETFDLRKQTRYGNKRYIEPKLFDESTLFVQAQGNAIREFVWVDNLRGYSSDAVSLISEEHLNDVQEVEVLYGGYDRPEQITFFVNGDGTITWYHAARAEQIRTWGKWTTQGEYKSLTVIQDKLYALVDRDAGLFIERFELDVTLDCVTQETDTAKSVWAGGHASLSGETVQLTTSVVQADHDPDYYLGEYIYTAGSVDISPIEVDNLTIGLGFTQSLETMPIEVQDRSGVTGGMPKRLVSADVYLASTLAVQLEGNRVTTFLAQNDLSVRPTAITGVRKFYLLGYNERPTIAVENEIPVPCEVLSLGAEVEY